MKIRLTLLAFFCTTLLFAQQKIFQTAISESKLSATQKVSSELASTYLSTTYYQQSPFNLAADLEIKLPNSKIINAKFKKTFTYTNKSESFIYAIQNKPEAELVLSKVEGMVTGMYTSGDGEKFIFHQTDAQIFGVSLVNESTLINKDSKEDYIFSEAAILEKVNENVCLPTTPLCASTTIDVLVVFTPQAKNSWGGSAQSKSFIATAITNFNIALQTSGVPNVTINLVYSDEIEYTESGSMNTDLTRFRTADDTFLDTVQNLRTTYGADLCALVINTPTSSCGLGYLNTNPTNYSASSAFTVTLFSCVVSNYTLAHEMGHNMGLNHDWYVNQSVNPCEHHHGYVNRTAIELGASSTTAQRWRTIMAYNDECSSVGFSCRRINRWANPDVDYNEDPTGIAIGNPKPSDEVFGFKRFACVVSQFVNTVVLATGENKNIEDFTLFPVPAQEELNVLIKSDRQFTYVITNALGQTVLKSEKKNIKVKSLLPGQYFLNVYTDKSTLIGSKKFLIK